MGDTTVGIQQAESPFLMTDLRQNGIVKSTLIHVLPDIQTVFAANHLRMGNGCEKIGKFFFTQRDGFSLG